MKKSIITGLVILSVAATSLMAFGPDHKGKGFGHKPPMAKIMQELDLTDAQKASFKELRAAQKDQREAFRQERCADAEVIFTAQGFDREKFISKATAGFQDRIHAKADFIEKAYAILNENQRAELANRVQEMRVQRGK